MASNRTIRSASSRQSMPPDAGQGARSSPGRDLHACTARGPIAPKRVTRSSCGVSRSVADLMECREGSRSDSLPWSAEARA